MPSDQIIKNVGKIALTSVKKVGKAVAIGSIMAMLYVYGQGDFIPQPPGEKRAF